MTETQGNGPSWPERRARRTAANAALGDFRREVADWLKDAGPDPHAPDWLSWSHRLADSLSLLIPCVGEQPEPALAPVDAMIAALDAEPDHSDGIDPRTWREVYDARVVSVEDVAHAYAVRIQP